MRSSSTPLAWLNLVHDKRRLVVSVAGIAFAVLLMFMQIGFLNALLDGTVQLIRQLDADLVILGKLKYSLSVNASFPRRRLLQAQEVEGVQSVVPLYIEYRQSLWKVPDDRAHPPRHIRVLAFDPAQPAVLLPEVVAHAQDLQLPDTALIDSLSKKEYGAAKESVERELAGRSIRVVGTFRLGTDFVNDGNVIVSERNFCKFFPRGDTPEETLSCVELGLIKIAPGADPSALKHSLARMLPDDVVVLTREEFVEEERSFWLTHAPIGFVFGLGTVIGFIVGMVICYQILASDVTDHLAEFATLKAIGYHDRYLNGVVLREALWLALFGFIPGLAGSALLYHLLGNQTGLPLVLTWQRLALVLVLTILMCIISGFLALRKVRAADPAEVF